jgi:hypothetical protein
MTVSHTLGGYQNVKLGDLCAKELDQVRALSGLEGGDRSKRKEPSDTRCQKSAHTKLEGILADGLLALNAW